MFVKKIIIFIICLFFSVKAYGASFTFPTTLKDSGHENTFVLEASLAF